MKRKILIKCREKKTRQQVAKELGITPQMLGMIERGDRTPSLDLANKISDYYGVSIEELFFNQNRNDLCPKVYKSKTVV